MSNSDPAVRAAAVAYAELCRSIGTTDVDEENAILSVGRENLPACALAVLDDRGGESDTVEYWAWLESQTQAAQDEHDAEYAAGHEWHHGEVQ